jgi:hypothetical protein
MKMRLFGLACAVSAALGCSLGAKPQGTPFKPGSITKILLRIPPANLAAGAVARPEELAARIGKNLGGWGYPVATDAAGAYSHVMEAAVSGVEKKSTPPGFSFSAGNSDPRAMDFQRADVVTVTCTLRPKGGGDQAYLKEEFVAERLFKSEKSPKNDSALFEAYVDHIGTACFNLLSELKVKRNPPASSQSAAWFPEVSLEVKAKPAPLPSGPIAPAATPPAAPEESGGKPEAEPETSSIRTETRQGPDRKQIVIHNHGAPILLEFGYERR